MGLKKKDGGDFLRKYLREVLIDNLRKLINEGMDKDKKKVEVEENKEVIKRKMRKIIGEDKVRKFFIKIGYRILGKVMSLRWKEEKK